MAQKVPLKKHIASLMICRQSEEYAVRKRSRFANWMGGIVISLLGSMALLYFFQGPIINYAMTPPDSFDETVHPEAPDYGNPDHWAALPGRNDAADLLVSDDIEDDLIADRQAIAEADVFYVHPTTLLLRVNWNQPLDHSLTNLITDEGVIRNQASAFNNCCRVFAPRYRQATLRAFSVEGSDGTQALDLAYIDVKAAFRYYLEHYNDGRPFIIAGHSQGAVHALRMIEDKDFFSAVRDQLVAAYIIGIRLPMEKLSGENEAIVGCQQSDDTGCILSWNTMGLGDVDDDRFNVRLPYGDDWVRRENVDLACINPISWKTDEIVAPADAHLGAIWFSVSNDAPPGIDQNVVSAQCRNGLLRITEPTVSTYTLVMMGPENYHAYDFSLFYMDIRKNAVGRVNAWLAGQAD